MMKNFAAMFRLVLFYWVRDRRWIYQQIYFPRHENPLGVLFETCKNNFSQFWLRGTTKTFVLGVLFQCKDNSDYDRTFRNQNSAECWRCLVSSTAHVSTAPYINRGMKLQYPNTHNSARAAFNLFSPATQMMRKKENTLMLKALAQRQRDEHLRTVYDDNGSLLISFPRMYACVLRGWTAEKKSRYRSVFVAPK